MKTTKLTIIIILFLSIISCDSSKSLQKYIVEKQQSNEFISLDIPASILTLKEENATVETINALKSIKKFNFLGLKLTNTNKELYNAEKQEIKDILSNKKFKELLRIKSNKNEVTVKYLGVEDNIDEVIFFGADNEKGLALVRILGENMDPSQMLNLINKINLNQKSGEYKSLSSIFDAIK